jgi:hypothetical protein
MTEQFPSLESDFLPKTEDFKIELERKLRYQQPTSPNGNETD